MAIVKNQEPSNLSAGRDHGVAARARDDWRHEIRNLVSEAARRRDARERWLDRGVGALAAAAVFGTIFFATLPH